MAELKEKQHKLELIEEKLDLKEGKLETKEGKLEKEMENMPSEEVVCCGLPWPRVFHFISFSLVRETAANCATEGAVWGTE
jgi:hypothetical protein